MANRDSNILEYDGWRIDIGGHYVTSPSGEDVLLTNAEFNLFAVLAKASNRVLSRDSLLDAVSCDEDAPSGRLIDVLISRVRKKVKEKPKKPKLNVTVPGCGYKFICQAQV